MSICRTWNKDNIYVFIRKYFFIERYKDAYNLQLSELISLHNKRIKPRSTFEDGYLALKIANAAYKSLIQKRVIKLK